MLSQKAPSFTAQLRRQLKNVQVEPLTVAVAIAFEPNATIYLNLSAPHQSSFKSSEIVE
jgi:hypothetical protein